MYANRLTPSMARAIDETNRRRALQTAHNETHGIRPTALRKKIRHTVAAQYAESQHPTTGTSYNRKMAA